MGALGAYLYELLARTKYLSGSTSIGLDVISGFHILSLVSIGVIILCLYKKTMNLAFLEPVLIFSLLIEVSFIGLNINGTVWYITK